LEHVFRAGPENTIARIMTSVYQCYYVPEKQGCSMDSHKVFLVMLVILALFVIVDGIWVIISPPAGDELQAVALVVIGIFMLLVGYHIAERKSS
jgi:hypothetical protein